MRDAGLPEYDGAGHKLVFHSFRHTTGTWLCENGVDLKVVQEVSWSSDVRHDGRPLHARATGARAQLGLGGQHPLFCTLVGARMGDAYIRVLLPRLARKAGIEKRVHAHGLRHTHAAQLRMEGVDIGIISKQLGHRSIATTARYLDHIAPQPVLETIRRRCWQAD